MQISKLEDELGQTLLTRHSRGVTATEPGRTLAQEAKAILARVVQARDRMDALSDNPQGTVALGVTPTIGRVLVPALLDHCRSGLPQISVTVVEGLSEELMRGVASRRLNLAFSYNPQAAAGPTCVPLLLENLYFVGALGRQLDDGDSIPFADICRQPLIVPSRPHGIRVLLEDTAAAAGRGLDVKLEIDTVSMERDMIEKGAGFTVLPYGAIAHEVEAGRMFAKEIVQPTLSRLLYLVTPGSEPATGATAEIHRLIETMIARSVAEGAWRWKPAGSD